MIDMSTSNHPLIQAWIADGWHVVKVVDRSVIPTLAKQGYEPSVTLLNIWYRKP